MKYLSVCSGIEAASVAWHCLGWKPLALSEIEDFPRAVLAHHHPDVPLHGDFTRLRDHDWIEEADILVGGTPCQAFSVAGLRNSLSDERGNLSLEFVRLADAIDNLRLPAGKPGAIIVWENVPGVLTVRDNAFGCFLAALAGDDTPYVPPRGKWTDAGMVIGPARTVAWRILDAQYFGVAQRRKRVFVVASSRAGFDPAKVLFEFEGVRRDTPPSREAGKIAPTIPSRSTAGGGLGTDFDLDGGVIRQWPAEIASTLNAHFGTKMGLEDQHALGGAPLFVPHERETMGTITARMFNALGARDVEEGAVVPCYLDPLNQSASTETAKTLAARNDMDGMGVVTHSLRAEGFDASEDGTGRGTPLVPVYSQEVADPVIAGEQKTYTHEGAHNFRTRNVVAFQVNSRDEVRLMNGDGQITGALTDEGRVRRGGTTQIATGMALSDVAQPLRSNVYNNSDPGMEACMHVMHNMAVRRLTPVECERLQGFPDNYTAIPWRKKPPEDCPDGPRYKALGNSMAVPVMRWIGQRIAAAL